MKWLNGILVPRVFVAPRSWSWARTRHVTSDAIQEVQWLPRLSKHIYLHGKDRPYRDTRYTVNRRLMIDFFGPHHVSTADDERVSEIEQTFEVVRGRQLHWFLSWFLRVNRLLTRPKLGSGRNSAKFWRLSAQTVLGVARLVFFLCLCRGISAKWGINRPKTPQNHSRQHRKTKISELCLSDCHQADFGDEMLRFAECGIYETSLEITCVLPGSTVANYKQ